MSRIHLVLGATGAIGSAVVRELLQQDERVRIPTREVAKYRTMFGGYPSTSFKEGIERTTLAWFRVSPPPAVARLPRIASFHFEEEDIIPAGQDAAFRQPVTNLQEQSPGLAEHLDDQ